MKNEQLEKLNQQSSELLRAAKEVFEEDIREKKKQKPNSPAPRIEVEESVVESPGRPKNSQDSAPRKPKVFQPKLKALIYSPHEECQKAYVWTDYDF